MQLLCYVGSLPGSVNKSLSMGECDPCTWNVLKMMRGKKKKKSNSSLSRVWNMRTRIGSKVKRQICCCALVLRDWLVCNAWLIWMDHGALHVLNQLLLLQFLNIEINCHLIFVCLWDRLCVGYTTKKEAP